MSFIDAVRGFHIAAGCVALATFAVPLVTRKGGPTHRRFGWTFIAAISVVAITALVACIYRLLTPSSVEARRLAILLGYLSLLSANSARTGLRVLRFKPRALRHDRAVDIAIPGGTLAAGIALSVWGHLTGFFLAIVFGIVGVIVAVRHLRYWLSRPSTPRHWKYQHMTSMVGACIAALTAFLVVNARALGVPPPFETTAWLAPTLVGFPGVLLWAARLRTRESPGTVKPAGTAGTS